MSNIINVIKNNAKFYMILSIVILLGTIGVSFALVISKFNAIAINTNMLDINAEISYDTNGNGEDVTSTGNMLPISDELVTGPDVTDSRVLKATFNVTGDSNNPENTIYDIALHNINVDCDLRTKDLKWRLYKGDELISREDASLSPTFDTMNNNRLVLTETQEDLTTSTDKYTFLLWISESCTGDITQCTSDQDQSKYLGKEFSASIKVELSTKSKKTIDRITGSEDSCNYTPVEIPACNNLTYNGNTQTLISTDSSEYTLINTTGINAGTYKITAELNDGCKWSNGSTDDKVFTCNIDKKDVTVTTLDQTITYGNKISSEVNNVTVNNLISGDTLDKVSLTSDTVDVGTGKISTNNVKILNGSSIDVTSNYNIIKNNTGIVTINCSNIAVEPNVGNVMYTGEELTGVSGGSYITVTGTKVGTEIGSYKAYAVPNKNYCWSDGTTNEIEYTWNIQYGLYTITYNTNGGDLLPNEYTRLEYIESTGTEYIDTGYIPNQDTSVSMDAQIISSSTTINNHYAYFGARDTSNRKYFSLIKANTTWDLYWQYDGQYSYFEGGTQDLLGTRKTIRTNKNIATVNGTSLSVPYNSFNIGYNMYLFGCNDNNNPRWLAPMKLYSTQIYDNGVLVRNYIPVKNSSGTIGLYDLVNKVFYTNSGSGTFNAGPTVENNPIVNDFTIDSDDIILPIPFRIGYIFDGWYTNEDLTGEVITQITKGSVGNKNLYAKWTPITYTINFYDNMNYVNEEDTLIATLNNRSFWKSNSGSSLAGYFYNSGRNHSGPILISTSEDAVTYYSSHNYTDLPSGGSLVVGDVTYYYSSSEHFWSGDFTNTSSLFRQKFTLNKPTYYEGHEELVTQFLDAQTSILSEIFVYDINKELPANTYTREGYTFKGWSTSPTGEVVYTDKQNVNNLTLTGGDTINLYAIWEANKYNVNFYENQDYIYSKDSVLIKLGSRTYYKKNDGAALLGYVVSQDWTTPFLVSTSEDAIVYYAPDNSVCTNITTEASFEYNGVIYYYSSAPCSWVNSTAGGDENVRKYSYTDMNIADALKKAAKQILIDNSTTLSQNLTYGVRNELTANTYMKKGHTFKGWSTSPTGDVIYNDKDLITFSSLGSINLYAIWEPNEYTINFYDNLNFMNEKDGVIVTLAGRTFYKANNEPALVGYMYNDWGTGPLLVGTTPNSVSYYDTYDSSSIHTYQGTVVYDGITYYYSPLTHLMEGNHNDTSGLTRSKYNYVNISDAALALLQDNSTTMSQTITYGVKGTLSSNTYTKSEYYFSGWGTSPTGNVIYSNGDSSASVYSDNSNIVKLYAIWNVNNRVIIQYNTNGGNIATSSNSYGTWTKNGSGLVHLNLKLVRTVVNYGSNLSSDGLINYNNTSYMNISRTGYYVTSGQEWICLSGCSTSNKVYSHETVYNSNDFCNASSGSCTVTLGVNWKLNYYTVSYNANGGSGAPAAQTKYYGTTLKLQSGTPSRTGYTFKGWSTSSTATSATYQPNGDYTSNSAATLYAVWSANTNTKYVVNHYTMNLSGSGYTLASGVTNYGTTAASITPAVNTYTGFTSPSTQTTTIKADGSTVVSYYYSRNKYYLDLNGIYNNGSSIGNISTYGTADVYVNGTLVANDVNDYNAQYYYGSTYEIKDVKAKSGYQWCGTNENNATGTIGAASKIVNLVYTNDGSSKTLHSPVDNNINYYEAVVEIGAAGSIANIARSSDNPTSSSREWQVTSMPSSLGWTGYVHKIEASTGAGYYYHKFIAKIPTGVSVRYAGNHFPFEQAQWLTSTAGTGKWETYAYKYPVSASLAANASANFGFIYLVGTPTNGASSVIWNVAFDSTYGPF